MRVVWLYGSPGVGKSTVAWQLYEELTAGGSRWGYVDIDQLGMCYPAGEDDPDRHRLKGSVLGALLPNYAAAGIRTLVVSGVLDPALAGWTSEQLVGAEVTFCRLVVGEQELRRRLDQRGGGESWDAVRRADQELRRRPARAHRRHRWARPEPGRGRGPHRCRPARGSARRCARRRARRRLRPSRP